MSGQIKSKYWGLIIALSACATLRSSNDSSHEPDPLSKVRPLLHLPVQITVGNDANLAPNLSLDGRYLAYTTSINGNKEVMLRDRQKGRLTRITHHPADDFSPVLSPDAKYVALLSRRRDAAGDVAIVAAGGLATGLLSERDVSIANRPETEELAPAWWPTGDFLLVPTRDARTGKVRLRNLKVEGLVWSDWAETYGEFPEISADGKSVLYVRDGSIFLNNASGTGEQRIKQMGGGVWSRPRFSAEKNEIIAIRYHNDTNRDGKIDGLDAGTVWRFAYDPVNHSAKDAEQLTSPAYNAFVPDVRSDGLFVTLQAKGALEIFKFPVGGQGRPEWLTLPERRWLDQMPGLYDRVFALTYVARANEKQGKRSEAAQYRIRALTELAVYASPLDVSLSAADFRQRYQGDDSIGVVTHAIEVAANAKEDLEAIQAGKAGGSNRDRAQSRLIELRGALKRAQAFNSGVAAKADVVAIVATLIANHLRLSKNPAEAAAEIKAVPSDAQPRFQYEAKLVDADITGDATGTAAREARLTALLADGKAPNDLLVEAAQRLVRSVEQRAPDNEELTGLRQRSAELPILPPLLHELVAKRFVKEKKHNIAVQEYRQILEDHCKDDPAVTVQMAKVYVDTALAQGTGEEVDQALGQLANCVERLEAEKVEVAVLRAQALVRRGLVLMRERDFGVAFKVFRQATEIDPDNLGGWRGLIDTAFKRKILGDELRELEKRYDKNPNNASAAYAYGYGLTYMIDLASGPAAKISAIDNSIKVIERAKDLNPSSIFPYQTLGWLHMQKGHWVKRQRTEGGITGKLSALVAHTRQLFGRPEEDQIELGVDSFLAAIYLADEGSLERANLLQNLGEAYHELENHQKALLHLGERINTSKIHPFADRNMEASVYRLAGRSAFQIDELELAESIQRKGLELWEAGGNDQQISYSMDALALTLREEKKYADAVVVYNSLRVRHLASKRKLELYRTISNIGYCQYMNGELTEALSSFDESQKWLDDNQTSLTTTSKDKAIEVDVGGQASAAKGFDTTGLKSMNLTFIARIHEQLGHFEQAAATYRQKVNLLDAAAKDLEGGARTALLEEKIITRNNLGLTLVEAGQLSLARDELRLATIESKDLRSKESVSSDETLNLVTWARLELRLAVLGVAAGQTLVEAKERLGAIDTAVALEREKPGSQKWDQIAAKIRLVRSALESINAPADGREVAKAILATVNDLGQDSFVTRARRLEYGAAGFELALVPPKGSLKDAMRELRRAAVAEDSALLGIRYFFAVSEHSLAADKLESAVLRGAPLTDLYEEARAHSIFAYLFDHRKNQNDGVMALRRLARVMANSYANVTLRPQAAGASPSVPPSGGVGENEETPSAFLAIASDVDLAVALGGRDTAALILDWGGVFRGAIYTAGVWTLTEFNSPGEASNRLPAQIERLFFSCYGKRCETLRAILSKAEKRTSVVASPEQIPFFVKLRRIAKASMAVVGERASATEEKIKKDLPDQDSTFAVARGWKEMASVAGAAHVWVMNAPLYIGHERPWNGEFVLTADNTWPLRQAALSAPWYNTAFIAPRVVAKDTNVNPMEFYSYLAVWLQIQKVPTGIVAEMRPSAGVAGDANENALAGLKKILAGSTVESGEGFVGMGDPGVFAADALEFAKTHLEPAKENALDARDDGEFLTAKRYYLEALHYAGLLKNDADYLAINESLVKTLFQARDYQTALHFQRKRVELLKANKADEEVIAGAEMEAGILGTRANLGAIARQYFLEAEKFYIKDQDDEKLPVIKHYIAMSYEGDGEYEKTIQYYDEARVLYEKLGKKAEAAQKILDIGNIYKERLSNLPTALDFYGRAHEAFSKAGQNQKLVSVQIDRANTLMAMGETKWAINVIENRVLNEIEPDTHTVLWIRSAQIVANAYYRAGMFQESQAYIGKIKAEIPKLKDETSRANSTVDADNLLAMNLEKLGKHAEATEVFDAALKLTRQFRLRGKESMILNNIGFWAREAGDVTQSQTFFQTALAIDRDLKSEADQAYDLRNMAMSWTLLGDLVQATAAAEQALAMSTRLKIAHNEAYSLFALAEILLKKNQPDDALKAFARAREVAEKAYLQDFVWRAYAAVASVEASQQKLEDSAKSYAAAVKIIESLRAGLSSQSSRTGFASDRGVQDVYAGIVRVLMKLGRNEEAWSYSERGRARAFIDAMGSRAQSFGEAALDQAMDEERKLRSDVEVLERRVAMLPPNSPDLGKVQADLANKIAERQSKIEAVTAKWPKVTPFIGVKQITLSAVSEKIGRGTALLEYMSLGEETAYWVIRDGKISGGLLPLTRTRLKTLIDQYRELMQNFAAVRATGKDLSLALISEPLKYLDGAEEVVIVPHGELHYLPFASLPVGDKYLIDQFPISYLESAEMLRFAPSSPRNITKNSKLVAFGNPDRGPDMNLPFAEREVKAIDRSFPNAVTVFGKDVTEERLTNLVANSDIVHFAGHGEFVDSDPAASRLLLADTDDLTVQDMFGLKMPVALVTLSACETGLGKLSSGDEMVGFNRALFFAGAESIVSSLWRVSDVASSVTVKRFYKALSSGVPRAKALKEAQLIVRRYYNHPAYWSAFKLSGENN